MIVELRVRDLATIEDVTLPLGSGLNVLTGETGAGKSMLVDALALLLGARADAGAVRTGASRAVVEGAIEGITPELRREVAELGLEAEDDRLVLRREVTSEGRSRGWVNGSPVTMATLTAVGAYLVDLHGQHETRTLLQPESQREVLDSFGDAEGEARGVAVAALEVTRLRRAEDDLVTRREEVRRRADYLRHVVGEIDAARLRAGEEEGLETEARRLGQATALSDLAQRIASAVDGDDGSALSALGSADRALGSLEKTDPSVAPWHELLDTAFANLQELGRLSSEYAETLQEDPARLAEVERRRDVLFRLRQKYGESVAVILESRRKAAEELDLLDTADLDLRNLAAQRVTAERVLCTAAEALSAKRRDAAGRLGRSVTRLLPKVGLPGGKLNVLLSPLDTITAHGQEAVELMVQLNPGLDPRPLARSASGGELSRLMLAIKTVLGRHDRMPSLVFDEVDQGIGGEVGAQVAEMLVEVAERHQVLVITHLAPIAARADRHLVVAKAARRGVATSDVQVLHGEDRVQELARMLGDAEAATARRHALSLLNARSRRS